MSESVEIKKSKVKKSEALWLMTFSDLSFILMCFFILLLTFSEPKKDKFDNVSTGMSAIDHDQQKVKNLKYMEKKVKEVIKKNKLDSAVDVKLDAEGLAIEFKNAAVFKSGSARPNPRYQKTIGRVLKAIGTAPERYTINIEGHTDDEKMRGGRFREQLGARLS